MNQDAKTMDFISANYLEYTTNKGFRHP